MSQEISHSFSCNNVVHRFGADGGVGNRYQGTSNYSSHNHVAIVDVDRRGGYRYQTSNS